MKNKPIIALFEENERNISALYAFYAAALPQHKKFWEKISAEEISHANRISRTKITDGKNFKDNNFSRGIVNHVMSYVLEELERAKKGDLTHAEALRTALRVERSMLEQKCFEIFSPNNNTLGEILKKLNQETEGHVEMLLDEMKRNKFPL